MKRKNGISLIIALLMIASTFVAGAETTSNCDIQVGGNGALEVTKKVWNGENWVDTMPAEIGDTIQFNITITYHEGDGYVATDIVVEDTLDLGGELSYAYDSGTANFEPSLLSGFMFRWNLTEDYGVELYDGESVSVLFGIILTAGCGTLTNFVEVYALEHCCQQELYDEDQVTVTVECDDPCEPEIEVVKKVWNGTAWADEIHDLRIGETVRFKIDIIYHACDDYVIKNMIVQDILPCCLEYVNDSSVVTTTGTGSAQPADITVSPDKKEIIWDWTYNNEVTLNGNDSLIIEFDASFENYCELDENCVYVEAWGCSGPTFTDEDCVLVNCTKPDNEFDKTVIDEGNEYQEINTSVGEVITFKLAFTYYGQELHNVNVGFVDYLPCILEYADDAGISFYHENSGTGTSVTPDVSEDGKTIWYNLTNVTLTDGKTIAFTFDALVNGSTGGCGDCPTEVVNIGCVEVWQLCEEEIDFYECDELIIRSEGNCPPDVPDVTGPQTGLVDQGLQFKTTVSDPDDDQACVMWSIGDETTEWSELVASETEVKINRSFSEPGTYYVKAKAKDEHGVESDWTIYPLEVVITEEEEETGPFDFSIKKYSIGYVMVMIENSCEENLTDIAWNLTVTGGILNRINQQHNCTIEELAPGEHADVYSSKMFGSGSLLGFGKVTVKITAEVDGEEYSEAFYGLVLGKLFVDRTIKIL